MPKTVTDLTKRVESLEQELEHARARLQISGLRQHGWSRLRALGTGAAAVAIALALTVSSGTPGQAAGEADANVAELAHRLDALEKEVRSTAPKVLKVIAPFEVVDKAGKSLLQIAQLEDQGAVALRTNGRVDFQDSAGMQMLTLRREGPLTGLVLINADGKGAAVLRADNTAGFLILRNGSGKEIAYLGTVKDGGSALVLQDDQEKELVRLGRSGDDSSMALRIKDPATGTVLAQFGQSKSGGGAVLLRSADGKLVAGLGEGKDGGTLQLSDKSGTVRTEANSGGHVLVFDPKGSEVASLGVESDGRGFVTVRDGTGTELVSMTTKAGNGILQARNAAGKGVVLGANTDGNGDVCVTGSKKTLCFSTLAVKAMIPF